MTAALEDTLAATTPGDPARTATLAGERTAARSAGLATGQRLGHFRIERPLGAGGMGEVYLATDLALDRPVAIKVLPEQLARDPGRRERLVREARAQARIVHPNVGHLYFIGEEDGRMYFAMEYVAGETLADRVARGPLPPDEALDMIRGAALGLREAHRHGFTHRDVKPSNLMIDGHGGIKVLDFGLAASPAGEHVEGPVAQTSLAGTPLYMAPEQARGDAIDFRADVYALGATLYHLASGHPPFQAEAIDDLRALHATAERPAVPRGGRPRPQLGAIDALCARMMALRPEDRFASYDELLRAIELASSRLGRPAGFVVRAIATTIDVGLAAVATALVGALSSALGWPRIALVEAAAPWIGFAIFHTALVAARGTTPGKALLELEVVDAATAARPAARRAIQRAAALVAMPIALSVALGAIDLAGYETGQLNSLVAFIAMVIGLAMLLHASLRKAAKRALWDELSGTMVRYRTPGPTSPP